MTPILRVALLLTASAPEWAMCRYRTIHLALRGVPHVSADGRFSIRQSESRVPIRLIHCDTSQQPDFSALIRQGTAACDYADVRALQMTVATSPFAGRSSAP